MTGKRFEAPRFDWNILAALGALSEMRTHWSDNQPLFGPEQFAPQGTQNGRAGADGAPDAENASNRPVGSDRGIVGVGE